MKIFRLTGQKEETRGQHILFWIRIKTVRSENNNMKLNLLKIALSYLMKSTQLHSLLSVVLMFTVDQYSTFV